MQKQVVLITGCSEGGIGYGLAQEAARGKNTTVYASARSIERMQGLKACGCHLVALDVCWPQDKIAQVVATIVQEAGRIDVLINNAGQLLKGTATDTPLEASRKLFEVNYFGVLAVTQAVAPHMMRRRSGTICNVGSVASWINTPFMASYGASKAALASWTDSLRFELAPFGVKAVLLAPGIVKTHIGGGQNAAVCLPPDDSPFSKMPSVMQQLNDKGDTGPNAHGMPVEAFAKAVIPPILHRRAPPSHIVKGHLARVSATIAWYAPWWLRDKALAAYMPMGKARREAAAALDAAAG